MKQGVMSYSQVGEDLIASYLLNPKRRDITYIDIGCLWPIQHSNTYYFYERGGRGLCIDANPSIAEEYRRIRPRDTVVTMGVGAEPATLTYHEFEMPVYNTFSAGRASQLADRKTPGRNLVAKRDVPVKPLAQILAETDFLANCGMPDLVSLDVEGMEFEVLRAIDFAEITPSVIIVETVVVDKSGRSVTQLLGNHGYRPVAYVGNDTFYKRG